MKKLLIITMALAIMAAPVWADYEETRTMNVSADDVRMLRIDCGAGFLEIKGVDGLDDIEVNAEIFLEDMEGDEAEEFMEDFMKLDLITRGKTAKLVSKFENHGLFSRIFNSRGNKLINLIVRVPKGIEIKIDDGSGYIEVRDIEEDVTVDDGSGDLICENIKGSLHIDDGSGTIELVEIVGDIDIDDGSGTMIISDITGDVEIDDGSGNIKVKRVDGTVIVDDGSGNIKIDDVSEDVKIIGEGSGHCSITNVDGDIDR